MQELNTHTSIPNHEVIFDSVVGLKKLINARLKSSMDNQLSLLQQEFEELKQNNLQDTLDYFANEGMDISEVVKVTLDEKYKYPNPLEKAKTIHVIGVDKKSGEWLVKNVDSPNLESGIGADCWRNSRHALKKLDIYIKQHPEISLHLTNGRGNSYFSTQNSTHIFLVLEHQKNSFIFDPSLNWIWPSSASGYTINRFFKPEWEKWIQNNDLWKININTDNKQLSLSSWVYPLWIIGDGIAFICWGICTLPSGKNTPILMIDDLFGRSYYSFLDEEGNSVHTSDYSFYPGLKKEVLDVLRYREKNLEFIDLPSNKIYNAIKRKKILKQIKDS